MVKVGEEVVGPPGVRSPRDRPVGAEDVTDTETVESPEAVYTEDVTTSEAEPAAAAAPRLNPPRATREKKDVKKMTDKEFERYRFGLRENCCTSMVIGDEHKTMADCSNFHQGSRGGQRRPSDFQGTHARRQKHKKGKPP